MDITLRRARKLSQDVLKAANAITFKTAVNVSVHEPRDVETIASEAAIALQDKINQYISLMSTYGYLREAIGRANAHKINDLMTNESTLKLIETKLATVVSEDDDYRETLEPSVVKATIASALNATQVSAIRPNSFRMNIANDNLTREVSSIILKTRRSKDESADTRTYLDMTTTIRLSDEVVTTVTLMGFIAKDA